MLSIDESKSVADARGARDAARLALEQIARERARLPLLLKEARARGSFEEARRIKDEVAYLEERADFAALQVQRAECVLLAAQCDEAQQEAARAGESLESAIADEEAARRAHQEATARMAVAQSEVTAAVLHLEDLQRQHAQTKRRLEQ